AARSAALFRLKLVTENILEDFCAELAEPLSLAFARECVEQAQSRVEESPLPLVFKTPQDFGD
ncbi:MAG: hypothetical protein ACO31I_06675, partial [Prochlorotrichaceae cyanobacterium]